MRSFPYPVFLDLQDVPVLVVGAGPIAARKVAGLVAAGARGAGRRPAMCALSWTAARSSSCASGPTSPPTSTACASSCRATGDAAVDATVAADATAAGIWVNAADQPADCSFILPAIARNGPLAIAVSTGGASPALARRLRDRAGELLSDDVVALAADLAAQRAAVRAAGGSTEDVRLERPARRRPAPDRVELRIAWLHSTQSVRSSSVGVHT